MPLMIRFCCLSALLLGALWAPLAGAKQLGFSLSYTADQALMSYRWRDAQGATQAVQLQVPQTLLQQAMQAFKPWDNLAINQAIAAELKVLPLPRGAHSQIEATATGISLRVEGPKGVAEKALRQLEAKATQQREAAIEKNFYTRAQAQALMPDHPRLVGFSQASLQPLAVALAPLLLGRDIRTQMNTALNFFQTIPYAGAADRQTAAGAGYVLPLRLMAENKGDCDSKAVAFLALAKNLWPQLPLVMVYTPYHALVGLGGVPMVAGDTAIEVSGQRYILAEPVGPALVPVGQIGPESAADLKAGRYSWRVVP